MNNDITPASNVFSYNIDIEDVTYNKIINDFNKLLNITNELKKIGSKIILVNGTYDILHYGHVKSLYRSKNIRTNFKSYKDNKFSDGSEKNNILVVLINSDNSIKELKGDSRPIITENQRAYMLASLSCVDYVHIFNTKRITEQLQQMKPDLWSKSGDYNWDNIDETEREVCINENISVMFLPKCDNDLSTSDIIKKVKGL